MVLWEVKPLYPMVMEVCDIEVIVWTHSHSCRAIELSWFLALFSKLVMVGSIFGKNLNTVVVEVGDKDLSRLVKCQG